MSRSSSAGVELIKLSLQNTLTKSTSFGSLRRPAGPLVEGTLVGQTSVSNYTDCSRDLLSPLNIPVLCFSLLLCEVFVGVCLRAYYFRYGLFLNPSW
jgi:hypothetical protein